MNLPSASNFALWLVGLNIRKYGWASQPELAAHCQPPLFDARSKSLSYPSPSVKQTCYGSISALRRVTAASAKLKFLPQKSEFPLS